jgi:carbon-monoxide dehydrogenase medium subunit
MPVLQAFHRPESLDEAFELLTNYQGRARALAGGTSLALATGPMTDALVDLSPVGIDAIVEQNDSLRVGAMARCATLRAKLAAQPGAVVDSVERMYTRVLQNQITVGGNCVLVTGWTDLPVAAWAVDAKFTLQSATGKRELAADDYFAKHPTKLLAPAELVTEVTFPKAAASAYLKQGRDATDEALASVAVSLTLTDDQTISGARIVAGAVRPMPQRLFAVEQALVDKPATSESAEAAARHAGDARVSDTYRASGRYRRALLTVLVRDAISLATERGINAGGGDSLLGEAK